MGSIRGSQFESSIQEHIILMYQAGATVQEISNEVEGASVAYVREVLKNAGILAGPGRHESFMDKYDDATLEAMFVDYYAEMPMHELVIKYNLRRPEHFYKLLHSLGRETRQISGEAVMGRKLRDEHAIEMYRAGAPIWQICAETGIQQVRLHMMLHMAGVPMRRKYPRP